MYNHCTSQAYLLTFFVSFLLFIQIRQHLRKCVQNKEISDQWSVQKNPAFKGVLSPGFYHVVDWDVFFFYRTE